MAGWERKDFIFPTFPNFGHFEGLIKSIPAKDRVTVSTVSGKIALNSRDITIHRPF